MDKKEKSPMKSKQRKVFYKKKNKETAVCPEINQQIPKQTGKSYYKFNLESV
jgi:hypothetical protein